MENKFWQRFFALFTASVLVFNSIGPLFSVAYATDETPVPTPITVEQAIVTPTPSDIPTESPTPTPDQTIITPTPTDQAIVSPIPSDTPTETPIPTPDQVIPTPTPFTTTIVETTPTPSNDLSPPVDNSLINSEFSATLTNPSEWTFENVELNKEYVAPQNSGVKLTFTKLPSPSGNLKIEEITLTEEQIQQTGSLSDKAYDITSDMADGTFQYNLTLPIPPTAQEQAIEIKSAETVNEVIADAEVVDEPKEVKSETITITGLNHFTVFVLVNDTDTDSTPGNSNDVANGVYTVLDDSWIGQGNPDTAHGTSADLNVRSQSGSQNQRAFINFDFSSIPVGAVITKATLRLFLYDAPAATRTYEIHRITGGWDQDVLTWNVQPSVAGVSTSSVTTGTSDNVWKEWNVTADVQSFVDGSAVNYGWRIKDTSEDSGTSRQGKFRSGDYSTVLRRPQLIVDFAEAGQNNTYQDPTQETTTTGDGFETNPTNAFTDANGDASNVNGAGDSHLFYDYGLSIPVGSTINGIEVRTDWRLDATGGTNSLAVELSWDTGTTWTEAKTDMTETNKYHIASLGGSTDLWGRPWNVDDFSNSNFRVHVTTTSTDADRDFYLDWIPVRVYYTPDTTAPTLESAETQDTNGNGQIDTIKLTFSENIDNSMLNEGEPDGWDVDGYTGESIGTGSGIGSDNDNILLLTFNEGSNFDSGDTLTVTYTQDNPPQSTHDIAGNELASDSWTTTDNADPILLSAETKDVNSNGQIDAIKLTFSEDIDDNLLNTLSNDGWDVDGYDGEIIGSGSVANDNILLLTINESGASDTQNTPLVSYSQGDRISTHDLTGNQLPNTVITSIDKAPPILSIDPPAGDYTSDQIATLTTSEGDNIYYTLDGSTPDELSTEYTGAITVDRSMTIKAIAYDNAGNASAILEATYGIKPNISGETSSSITSSTAVITWTTDDLSTSRVIYDFVSHPTLGPAPDYGYAYSTVEDSTKVRNHSVTLSGLHGGATYYFRTISHGSPDAVSSEQRFDVLTSPSNSTGGGGAGDGLSDGLGCGSYGCNNSANTSQGQILGVSTGPATGFIEEVLGTTITNPEGQSAGITPSPEESPEVLGNETTPSSSNLNWLKAILGILIALFVISSIIFWISQMRKKNAS